MKDLNDMTLGELYALRVQINNLIEPQEKRAYDALRIGIEVPNFKLKKGNKKRTWVNQEQLESVLRDAGYSSKDIYDIKFKGIPAIEKLLKGTDISLNEFIEIGFNKDTLVYTGE